MRAQTALSEDHYHWLTSLVAAHHLERPTCRLIAATAFLLGVIPLLLVSDQPDSHATARVAVTAAITLCTSVIAVIWATRCWPTRRQSRASAVTATVCVAAAVAVIPDPLVAALGVMAFAGPAGFTALFHTRLLLACTWAVAAATLAVATWRLAAADPLLAAAVVPLVVLVNVFAGFAWSLVVTLTDAKVSSALTDPVTGLLNRTAFDERMTTLLGARDRSHDRHLVVAVIGVDTHGLLMSLGQDARAERAIITAARQLRAAVRRDTVLAYRGDGNFLIAELFTTANPSVMLERLRGTLTDRPAQLSASIGAVSTPLAPLTAHPVNDVLDELLHLADQARHDAHRAGGNAARCTVNPALTILDDLDHSGDI
ncbi:diguanylate cyclase domain-containing protein [Mycolicibacterium hodleri]|uniref:diguanylate cyclase domain-containing protein n=1 Tax=Mycolicibacterium hodleri TaxID=49897 RepID=UPI00112D6175|nr:diguanylate cyclase [Mycolicibacterium hodleri]